MTNMPESNTGTLQQETFGWALELLKRGGKVARHGWNGKGMFVAQQNSGHPVNPMNLAFLYMSNVEGKLIPWVASQSDLLSEDWYEARK